MKWSRSERRILTSSTHTQGQSVCLNQSYFKLPCPFIVIGTKMHTKLHTKLHTITQFRTGFVPVGACRRSEISWYGKDESFQARQGFSTGSRRFDEADLRSLTVREWLLAKAVLALTLRKTDTKSLLVNQTRGDGPKESTSLQKNNDYGINSIRWLSMRLVK